MTEVEIMLVEDSAVDADLISEALKDAHLPHTLIVVQDGETALRLLSERLPQLVLLDLNIPKVGGLEILQTMRSDPLLRVVPVIVLTNSQSQDDVVHCYTNFANAYVRKPIGFEDLTAAIRSTSDFWFRTVTLPFVTPTSSK